MEFFFVLHRSLLTLVGRRALVCFDKVSITLTSARKLKLCSEQLSSDVERSFLYKYIFFLLLRYLPFTRVLLRRDSSFWGFKRWLPFFFTISLFFDTKVFFFSDLTLAYAMYHIVQRSGLDLFFLNSFFYFIWLLPLSRIYLKRMRFLEIVCRGEMK